MNSINFKSIAIIALLLFAGMTISLAQHDHGSHSHSQSTASPMFNPPHGGMMKMVGKYHIEMVVNMLQMEDKVSVYLLNSKGKTLSNDGITGTVMFMYGDNTTVKGQLLARGDDHFAAQLKSTEPFTAMVSLNVKGKTITASFEYGGLNAPAKTVAYTCPMKCEGAKTYDEPGSCPKCGMNLIKSK